MNIYKVLPDLGNSRQMKLWHKALRAQWSAEDIDWGKPVGVRAARLRDALGRVLTPVLMGEQSALYSVSQQIPTLGHRSEVPAQLYLTTWAVDEARHTEIFARYFHRLDREPLSIRRFPSGYLFQSRIMAKDTAEWLSGVLVSEVMAKLLMSEFLRLDLEPVLSQIAEGILEDEARHLAFNHLYMEQRFAEVYSHDAATGEESAQWLKRRLSAVLELVPTVLGELESQLHEMGIDRRELFSKLEEEVIDRLGRSIARGMAVAAGERLVPTGATELAL